MSKEMAVISLGLLVVVMPYLGIYRSWLTILMLVVGISLMILGFLMRGEKLADEHHNGHKDTHPKHPKAPRRSHVTFEENTSQAAPQEANHPHIGSLN